MAVGSDITFGCLLFGYGSKSLCGESWSHPSIIWNKLCNSYIRALGLKQNSVFSLHRLSWQVLLWKAKLWGHGERKLWSRLQWSRMGAVQQAVSEPCEHASLNLEFLLFYCCFYSHLLPSEMFCVVCCCAPIWQLSRGLAKCRGSSPVWQSTTRTDTWTAGEAVFLWYLWWVRTMAEWLTKAEGCLIKFGFTASGRDDRIWSCGYCMSTRSNITRQIKYYRQWTHLEKTTTGKRSSGKRMGKERWKWGELWLLFRDGRIQIINSLTKPDNFDFDQIVLAVFCDTVQYIVYKNVLYHTMNEYKNCSQFIIYQI